MTSNGQSQSLRDIRPDLKDRLREALTNRDFHAAKADEYGKEVDVLMVLLDREQRRFTGEKSAQKPAEPDQSLTDFILKMLHTRPMTKEDLRDYANRDGYA